MKKSDGWIVYGLLCLLVLGVVIYSMVWTSPQSVATTPTANLPACNSDEVELEVRRAFYTKFQGRRKANFLYSERQLSDAGNIRRCSAEALISPRSPVSSGHEYIEYQVEAIGTGWKVTITHEEDL